jgi:outer membrane receptor protein involved in Fe transport
MNNAAGMNFKSWLLTGMLCMAGLAATQAQAQTAPAESTTATETGRGSLQEVVVTATRREESLSKVPISVTALTQETMDEKGVKDFQDIVRFTPGVNIDNSGTNSIGIRGISSSAGAGTTGIYIDDTPIQMRSVGFSPDDTLPKTFDLQRVEILRGPQGTLFGAGAEGGAVRYIMNPASTTTADTYVRSELSYTQYGQPNGELGIARGQPIVDGVFGVRASVWYRYDGGWIDRVDPGTYPPTTVAVNHNVNYSNSIMGRLAADWQPSATVSVTPSILYQRQDKHDDSTYWPAYSNPGQGQFNTATPERIGGPDTYYLPALKVQWDLATSQLIGNASYFHRKQYTAYQGTVYDFSYWNTIPPTLSPDGCTSNTQPGCSWYPLIDATGIHLPASLRGTQTPNKMTNTQDSEMAEVRWQSTDTGSRWNWTVGVFWQLAKEGSIEELNSTNIDQVFNTLYGFSPTDYYGGTFYSCPTNAAYPSIPACDIYYNSNTTFDRQIAAYGEVGFAITNRLKLTLGERVAHTEFSLNHYADGYENYGPQPAQANQSSTPNTPKVVLSFQADPHDLYYLSWAKGFRVGGGNAPLPSYCDTDLANAGFPNGAPLTYGSDNTQNFEVGAKNAFSNWLQLATSVYYIKWQDIQQNLYVAGGCGLQFTDNLGTAVSKGFDVQAAMLFGPVNIDLAFGYTSARFTKNDPVGCTPGSYGVPNEAPCLAINGDAISGQEGINYAPGAMPPWTVALGVAYNFRLAERDAFVRADWEYESRNPWLAAVQDPAAAAVYNYGFSYTLPSTSFTSVRAGMTFGDMQLAAFCDNLFDSHTTNNYILGQTDGNFTPQQNVYTFRPRTMGVTLTWHGH